MRATGERFRLVLRAERSHLPAAQRLRSALKLLLRGYQLRCIELHEVQDDDEGTLQNSTPSQAAADTDALHNLAPKKAPSPMTRETV
jgi:hypothetical protein